MNFPDKNKLQRIALWLVITTLFAAPLEVFHSLLELLHILFEWTEASLDFIIEVMFDTSLHTTQIVVFYIIMAVVGYFFYWLYRGFPSFYRRKKQQLRTFLSDEIDYLLAYWHETFINKLQLLIAASGLVFLLFI